MTSLVFRGDTQQLINSLIRCAYNWDSMTASEFVAAYGVQTSIGNALESLVKKWEDDKARKEDTA